VKNYRIIIFLLLLCFLLTACAARQPALSEKPPANLPDTGKPAAVPTAGAETAAVRTVIPATAIPELMRNTLKPGQEFLTDEQREEMAQKMGSLGFSVLRYNENMLNYAPVAAFFQNATTGRDGEVTVYTYPWTYIISFTFAYHNGKMTCTGAQYTAAGVQSEAPQDITEFTYTAKGNLYYQAAGSSGRSGFRVLPLSEQSREYFRKYIVPGNIFSKGPLAVSWNSENFKALNWEWIFQGLWRYEKGTEMVAVGSEYYRQAADSMHFDYAVIPGPVVEGLLQKYFDVPAPTLQALPQYDEKNATYTFTGFNGGGYSPTLEVSKWQHNADGTLTLWVDFVALEFGKELAGQSVLTVRPGKDGSFKYIANQYTEQ
jgi:hypothetical protein